MSEIEKMYKKVGLASYFCEYPRFCDDNNCNECPYYSSPFTPEKQLSLIKSILASSTDRNIDLYKQNEFYRFTVIHIGTDKVFEGIDKDFAVALAGLINQLWQDLTEQERTEIADILKG